MIRGGGATALALAAACLCASGEALGAGTGRIEGRIIPPGAATRVSAIDRNVKVPIIAKEVPVREHKGRVLEGGSRYEITVPPGTYDLHFETTDGLKIEGADLRAEGGAKADPLKERDLKSIRERVRNMRTFENERSVLAIVGGSKRAKVLVRLVRTKPTSYDGDFGEPLAIFRWEVWNFKKYTGSWLKERKYKVLRRFMVAKRKMHELRWDFRPELGGVDVEAGSTVKRDADIAPTASRKVRKQDKSE